MENIVKNNLGEQFYDLTPYGEDISEEEKEQFLNNCGDLKSDMTEGRNEYIQNNSKIRFIVLAMGLPGSGKSSAIKLAIDYCKLLNSAAARKDWITENISHDFQITNSVRYQKAIRALLSQYRNKPFWTPEDWAKLSYSQKNRIEQEFNSVYNTIRQGESITKSDGGKSFKSQKEAEAVRRDNLKIYGFTHPTAGRLLEHKSRILHIQPKLGKTFSKQQINKMLPVSSAISTRVYTNLRKGVADGKNIAYEFTGANWTTIKKLLEAIVESTNNCEKYTYIILGTFNLITLQTAYKRMLCRFFEESKEFISTLNNYRTFSASQRDPLAPNFVKIPAAPRFWISAITSMQMTNDKLCKNMIDLLDCNTTYGEKKSRYSGNCRGVGIDLLLFIHNSPQKYQQDNIIETIPLSKRSMHLIKTTGLGGKSISNTKKQKEFIIDILNKIRKTPAQWRPLENKIIECPNKDDIIATYIEELFSSPKYSSDILQTRIKTRQQIGMLPIYKKDLASKSSTTGGKKTRRRKKRRRTKRRKKKTRKKKTRKRKK